MTQPLPIEDQIYYGFLHHRKISEDIKAGKLAWLDKTSLEEMKIRSNAVLADPVLGYFSVDCMKAEHLAVLDAFAIENNISREEVIKKNQVSN